MKKLDNDIISLLKKRVYDMAGILGNHVKVYLNDTHIKIKNFSDYVDLYLKNKDKDILKVWDK